MRFCGGVHTNGTVMQTKFAQYAAFYEGVQGFVNRRERDAGNLLPNHVINFFRTGMAGSGHERLVNDGSLVRDCQTVSTAEFTEISLAFGLHLRDLMKAAC